MKVLSTLLAFFLLFGIAAGQSPSRVLKLAEKALGGAKALKAVRSAASTGTVTRVADGAAGRYEMVWARPDLYHVLMDVGGFEMETGFNGRSAWSRDSREGLQTLTGEPALAAQARASFAADLWLNAKRDRSTLSSAGQATISGRAANAVLLTTNDNVAIKIYFDSATNLPIRDEMNVAGRKVITDYGDYRRVSGIMMPYSLGIADGDDRYDIKIEDIKASEQIDPKRFDYPALAGEPLPDLRTLLSELRANEDRIDQLLDTYAYTQKDISRVIGKDGVLRETGSETRQLSFYKGYRISRLIEKNGKPLKPSDQEDADKDAAKRVAEIEKLISKDVGRAGTGTATGTPSARSKRISVAEVLRASRLINPRRERFRGRDVIVFDFEPDPAFDLKNAQSMMKFFGKTAGVMWIDEKDKQAVRIEAVLADNFNVGGGVLAKLRKGASFIIEQERVNDEIWLPSKTDINLSVRVLLVKGIDVNQSIRSYDYRKFDTQVKDAVVNGDKPPAN